MSGPLKVVVSGPVGAGKTTFIRTLSSIDVVDTDELASEDIGKERTTVAMDFGVFHIEDTPVHLFGTPGQERFDFMWEVLCEGALGLVLLVSGQHPGQFTKARAILEFITSRIPVPFVVGVTHQDLPRVWDPEEVADYFSLPHHQVLGIDATSRRAAAELLAELLDLIVRNSSQKRREP